MYIYVYIYMYTYHRSHQELAWVEDTAISAMMTQMEIGVLSAWMCSFLHSMGILGYFRCFPAT